MRCLIILQILLLASLGFAQAPHCASNAIRNMQIDAPHFLKSDSLRPDSILHIPVVVHVIWHEEVENLHDSTIISGINALNRDFLQANLDQQYVPAEFANIIGFAGIQFCLAAVDPDGNPSTAITRTFTMHPSLGTTNQWYDSNLGGMTAWDPDQYLNIWVVNIGEYVTGFASYPGQSNAAYTGLVIHSRYFGIRNEAHYGMGRVATHEMGHFFGLQHPWADDSDCNTDDGISDTPPQYAAHGGCPTYPQSGCSASEMFMNFMDYVDDPCMLMFTKGQCQAMRQNLQTYRSGLLNTTIACQSPQEVPVKSLSVFPNPAQSKITLKFLQPPMKLIAFNVFNQHGQQVMSGQQLINNQLQLDVSELQAGMYYLQVEQSITRFIKQN